MIDFTFDARGFLQQFMRWIDRKQSYLKTAAQECAADAAKIVQEEIKSSIRAENIIASGSLLESVTVGSMQASTDSYTVMVGSSSPYASFVEEGRRAGSRQPPSDAFLEWMVHKGLEPDARSAYLIARKIGRIGIPAKRVFQKGIDNASRRLDAPLNAIVEKNLRKD